MGMTIKQEAGRSSIVADARTTHTNAAARGGVWHTLSEQRLAPVLAMYAATEAGLATARDQSAPLVAARDAERARAKVVVGRIADEIWNAVGRPANDTALALIFPGGISYYVDGDVTTQPKRMELLAKLLVSKLHPRLDPARAQAAAAEIRASAAALRQAIEAASGATIEVELHDRVLTAVARSAGAAMASLKKLYKAEGFRESEIHTVIPHRPRRTAAKAAATPKDAPPALSPAAVDPTG